MEQGEVAKLSERSTTSGGRWEEEFTVYGASSPNSTAALSVGTMVEAYSRVRLVTGDLPENVDVKM
jgi:hypothetical protein